jgi:hypothetical protein
MDAFDDQVGGEDVVAEGGDIIGKPARAGVQR